MSNPHDRLFKAVLGQPGYAAEHLARFLPPAVASALDLRDIELVPGSFVGEMLGERHTDLLYQTRSTGRPQRLQRFPEPKPQRPGSPSQRGEPPVDLLERRPGHEPPRPNVALRVHRDTRQPIAQVPDRFWGFGMHCIYGQYMVGSFISDDWVRLWYKSLEH